MIVSHLEAIGLEDSFDKSVGEFSGGMKRRVAIVRALLAKSEILFLDEPFKGLDDETKQDTIRYVRENLNGRTVIMVTHSREECRLMGGRLITIGRKDASDEN
jgi:NitT/TauT family transport system ATP-binding protein